MSQLQKDYAPWRFLQGPVGDTGADPENWTTIATGAWPGTHGIAVWGTHRYGERVTERHETEAMSSNLCKAEYIWEAAERQGLRSILHYFVGYPPTTRRTIHVDWIGWHPGKYYFELTPSTSYSRERRSGREEEGLVPVTFREAHGWANLPDPPTDSSPLLETELPIPQKYGEPLTYYVLLIDPDGQGYQLCSLSREKDFSKALCTIKTGDWSQWIWEKFDTPQGPRSAPFRFRLMQLSPDGRRFKLYKSQGFPPSDFTRPASVGEDLVSRLGPYINEGVARLFFRGLVDRNTFAEEYEYQIRWIYESATYLLSSSNAHLYLLHWHLPDWIGHHVLGMADPAGGAYDEKKAKRAWDLLRLGYGIIDRLVGLFLREVDDQTYLFVVSDHGSATNWKRYPIVEELAERGLVTIRERNGSRVVDWDRSKVFIDLTNLYVNLKGRYANGVVEPSEYESVRREAMDVLRGCKDQDGDYVLSLVLRREDAPVVGLWGENVGDIVFVYSPGFTWGHSPDGGGRSHRVGGANHGPKIPTAETDVSSNYATFMVIGGSAKRGYRRPIDRLGPVQLVDIAPTISYLLGIDPPRHSQGRILHDFFKGWDVSEVKRQHRDLRSREREVLEGDVTDVRIP